MPLFDVIDVENALASLKFGKAAGYDGLTKESLHYCHPVIFIHLKLLFNMMSVHGYVLDDFGVGVVVNDQCTDLCSADNYHPITLQLFRKCLNTVCYRNMEICYIQTICSLGVNNTLAVHMHFLLCHRFLITLCAWLHLMHLKLLIVSTMSNCLLR